MLVICFRWWSTTPDHFHWFAEFWRGRQSLQDDDERPGAPTTDMSIVMVVEVLLIFHLDPSAILHQHLHQWKLSAQWAHHNLTPEQKGGSIDCCCVIIIIISGDESWIYSFDRRVNSNLLNGLKLDTHHPKGSVYPNLSCITIPLV